MLQIVPDKTERPAHLIRVAVPRLNKCDWISEYLKQIETRHYDLEWAEVTETVTLDVAGWNDLMKGLLTDRPWLSGKGGTGTWADLPEVEYFKLSSDQQAEWKRCAFIYVLKVVAPTGQCIYIDPQGYDYARYVAFDATGLQEGKTRQEEERDRAKAEQVEKAAAIARWVANPPSVPADHGLRFYWNGIKHNNGPLELCTYSAGELTNYPKGTVTIYARDYRRFSKEAARWFHVENESDSMSDYFDDDKIRVCPNHPLYNHVLLAHAAQELHHEKRMEKRMQKYSGVTA